MRAQTVGRRSSRRWRRVARSVGLVLLLLLLIVAVVPVGAALVVSERPARVDAIVTLASHEWERLPEAAALAAAFPSASVLITEPPLITELTCHDCAHRVDRLERLGVARGRVSVVDVERQGTYGEAVGTLKFVQRAGIRRLVVVTSPYHTRRSLSTFRKVFAGSDVEIGVVPAEGAQADPARWWRHGYDRSYVAYEWAAIVYYRLRYGI